MNFTIWIFPIILLILGQSSCFTPKKEREIKDEVFSLKTRLIELEKESGKSIQESDTNSRRTIASTQSELEKMNLEIQRMKGELETIKLAVVSGEIPGSDPEADSVGKRIRDLETRLDLIEQSKEEPVAKNPVKPEGSRSKQVSVREIRDAFNGKKFQFVAENANAVLGRLKTKNTKEEISYYEAESLFRLGRYKDSALKFNDFSEQFPSSARIAHAKIRTGDAFKQIGDPNTAKLYYREIVTKFPKSEEAKKAKKNLEDIDGQGSNRYNKPTKKGQSRNIQKSRVEKQEKG